jgi:hypothetical protein
MPRFRKALATAVIAIATAGGGLLTAAASAAPAHAATAPAPTPAASHAFNFTVVPAARAAGGIGPKLQCGDFCDPNGGPNPPPPPATITCTISANEPVQNQLTGNLLFTASTSCTDNVPEISMVQNVITTAQDVEGGRDIVPNDKLANTVSIAPCVSGQYYVAATAYITPPAGWVVIAGSNPILDDSPSATFSCGGGSGGGGGCATGTPSVPAQPAARLPMVVTC